MLSNNPRNDLNARQRQHRRQNSTPSAFDGAKVPNLPLAARRQAASHRRGMSLDLRCQQVAPAATGQGYMVSTNTNNNTGLSTTSQHHVLREAQQQRIQARPGPLQTHYPHVGQSGSENYLISPHGTPHSQRFDTSGLTTDDVAAVEAFTNNMFGLMPAGTSPIGFGDNMTANNDHESFNSDSALSTPTFMNFSESPCGPGWTSDGEAKVPRPSRRISQGISSRVSKFENLGGDITRPETPPDQNYTYQYPPTPMETPHNRFPRQQVRPDRFNDGHDESMEATLKPNRNHPSRQAQSIFGDMRLQAEQQVHMPTAQQLYQTQLFASTEMGASSYTDSSSFNEDDYIKFEASFESSHPISQQDAAAPEVSAQSSSHTTPNPSQGMSGVATSEADASTPPFPRDMSKSQTPSQRTSPHRRTESQASIASAASISDINIDETKTETGVTLDEIAQYITGPDPKDGKWTCEHENCGKKFGRKENIKSHVQTHLNDRQYKCPTCKKCFVRQHDLKRHAKIHTGVKPYPCDCGNKFARHDALTRHRQRGMCIGSFEGTVRKVVKRGRPRKNRPDMEDRLNKSARTRAKNMSVSSVSSQSGDTDSSAANTPANDYQMTDGPLDMASESQPSHYYESSSAPMPSMSTRPSNVVSSPFADSPHSYVSPEEIMERTPSHTVSPARSGGSHYNSPPPPPELSQSPSPSQTHFYDGEANTSGVEELRALTADSSSIQTSSIDAPMSLTLSDQAESDILLQYNNDDSGLLSLDRDTSYMTLSKFDDEFDNGSGMFADGDDIFFGTS